MTVSDVTQKISYNGDDATVLLTYPFKVFEESDLAVYLDDTLKTITTHYTVVITATAEGGSITMVTPPATGETLLIKRVLDYDQTTDIPTEDNFPEEQVENGLDKSHMLVLQVKEIVERAIKFKTSSATAADRTMAEPSEGKGLVWDASGNLVNSTDNINGITTAAAASAAAALVSENAAAASETAAAASATAAATSETNAATSETNTAADVVSTNADVVLTGLDVVSTNADVVSTNADVVSTNADAVNTGNDVTSTNADVVSTNADVVLTGLDVVSTAADAVSTDADKTAAAASAAAAAVSETNAAASAAAVAYTKTTKAFGDFSTAGLTNSIELVSLPAKSAMRDLVLVVNTAFVGTGVTELWISIGITGALQKYFFEFDATQAANSFEIGNVIDMESITAATSIKITARAVGANLDQLSAGQIEVQHRQPALLA